MANIKQKTRTKTQHRRKKSANVRRGRRNRQRGAELQRQLVRMCKEFDIEAFNRDRGGANHEKGDVEIQGKYYGCKRRKAVPRWVLPEKEEVGVVFRGDNMKPMIAIPLEHFLLMLKIVTEEQEII